MYLKSNVLKYFSSKTTLNNDVGLKLEPTYLCRMNVIDTKSQELIVLIFLVVSIYKLFSH